MLNLRRSYPNSIVNKSFPSNFGSFSLYCEELCHKNHVIWCMCPGIRSCMFLEISRYFWNSKKKTREHCRLNTSNSILQACELENIYTWGRSAWEAEENFDMDYRSPSVLGDFDSQVVHWIFLIWLFSLRGCSVKSIFMPLAPIAQGSFNQLEMISD